MQSAMTIINKFASKNILVRIYKYYIIDSILIVKKEGLKSLLKKRGWKIFAVVIGYYVLRDSILYILIPYLAARNIF
jgi:hypothetical protein